MKNLNLFTVLLVTLLGGIESGQCFYNPQPGRWLNRDSVGEQDSPALYCLGGNDLVSSSRRIAASTIPAYEFSSQGILGKWICGLHLPVGTPGIIEIFNEECTRPCTMVHELVHERDQGDCCDKARGAYQAASEADRPAIVTKWNDYLKAMKNFSECNAYAAQLDCVRDMERTHCYPCSSFTCCLEIWTDILDAEAKIRTHCGTPDSVDQACPF